MLAPDTDYDRVRRSLLKQFPSRAREHAPQNPFIVAVKIDNIIVDFLLTTPGYEELIIERAVRRDLNGLTAWIRSAEDLIIQKIYSGRDKDWPDVEALLIAQRGKLDEAYLENWISQFAEVLEKPEILEKYNGLLAKSKALE